MTYDLSCLNTWLSANMIALNAEKTEIIIFRSRLKLVGETNIIFNGYKLNSSSSIKYLGVILDEHLNWDKHIFRIFVVNLEELTVHFLKFVIMFRSIFF